MCQLGTRDAPEGYQRRTRGVPGTHQRDNRDAPETDVMDDAWSHILPPKCDVLNRSIVYYTSISSFSQISSIFSTFQKWIYTNEVDKHWKLIQNLLIFFSYCKISIIFEVTAAEWNVKLFFDDIQKVKSLSQLSPLNILAWIKCFLNHL